MRRTRLSMVDVGSKPVTQREAVAEGYVRLSRKVLRAVIGRRLPKGDALAAAELAGIQAAKRVSELVPLCHQVPLDSVEVELAPSHGALRIVAAARARSQTGVEMEALAAVMAAALTVYDMTKGLDRGATIDGVCLLEKRGGESGEYVRASPGARRRGRAK